MAAQSHSSRRGKAKTEGTSNAIARKKSRLSVTPVTVVGEKSADKYHAVIRDNPLSPSTYHARLAPWMTMANALGAPVWASASERRLFPDAPAAEQLWTRLLREPAIAAELEFRSDLPDLPERNAGLNGLVVTAEKVYGLVLTVALTLHYLADVSQDCEFFRTPKFRASDTLWGVHAGMAETLSIFEVRGGRIWTREWAPFRRFVAVMNHADAGRIRRCPICAKLFYAKRSTAQACTKRCNHARTMRDSRQRQRRKRDRYELTRKLKVVE